MQMMIPLAKIDEEKRLIFGRAIQEVPDRAGEIIDYESAKTAFKEWSDSFVEATGGKSKGNLRVMHGKSVAGKIVDLTFNDAEKAIDVVAHVVDDQEWKKCIEGVYTGFSVGGSYGKKWKVRHEDGREYTKYEPRPSELSLVDRPCIPSAKFFDLVKADGSVEQVEFVAAKQGDLLEMIERTVEQALVKRLGTGGEAMSFLQVLAKQSSPGETDPVSVMHVGDYEDFITDVSDLTDETEIDHFHPEDEPDDEIVEIDAAAMGKAVGFADLWKRAGKEVRDGDGDGKIYDGTKDERPVSQNAKPRKFNANDYDPKDRFESLKSLAEKYPKTTKLPDKAKLDALKQNDEVKVSSKGEYLWAKVDHVAGDWVYGRVWNAPYRTDQHGLNMKSRVAFRRDNVFDVYAGKAVKTTSEKPVRQALPKVMRDVLQSSDADKSDSTEKAKMRSVLRQFKAGDLYASGKKVTDKKQALAIAMSVSGAPRKPREKRFGPSPNLKSSMGKAETFGDLMKAAKKDGRAGRDGDGDGQVNDGETDEKSAPTPKAEASNNPFPARTKAEHQQMRSENESYRAQTTQAIPETRGGLVGAAIGATALGIPAGIASARALHPKKRKADQKRMASVLDAMGSSAGKTVGGAAGKVAGKTISAAGSMTGSDAIRNAARRAGKVVDEKVAATGKLAGRTAGKIASLALRVGDHITSGVARGSTRNRYGRMAIAGLLGSAAPAAIGAKAGYWAGENVYNPLAVRRVEK